MQRCRTVALIWTSVGLELVDANFGSSVQIPARFGEERRHVAGRAFRLAIEERFASSSGGLIKAAGWRLGHRDSKLIKVQGGQFSRDQIVLVPFVA